MMRVIFLCLAVASSSAVAGETIPDVRSLNALRGALLWTLADGSRVRAGLSDGGSGAGPWDVLYCLLEHDGGAATRPFESTREASRGLEHPLGPLRYALEWDGAAAAVREIRMAGQSHDASLPVLYAG